MDMPNQSSEKVALRKLSNLQAGTLGELLTVAKLNTLGFSAYMSPEGAPGHDVMVVIDGKSYSIEVKTRQFLECAAEISRWPVNLKTKGDADFFIFIALDMRTLTPTFYVLTNSDARAAFRDYKSGGTCSPTAVRAKHDNFSALMSPGAKLREVASD